MSQTVSEIWTRCLHQPLSGWEEPPTSGIDLDEWPELVGDRLSISETGEAGWRTLDYRTIAHQQIYAGYEQLRFDFDVEPRFRHLVDQWRKETRYLSSLSKISMHPAYQKIIGIGKEGVPLILREMQERGGHWLWALYAITDEDPAPPNANFDEAVQAWLNWGRQRGYIA